MLTILKRYLPHILVAVALVSVFSAAYASVIMTTSQLRVTWNPNPVTISISPSTGMGSAVVQLTCNQNANNLVLTSKSQDHNVKLTVTPSTIPLCSSVPVSVTLTATCQPSQGNNNGNNGSGQNKCKSQGEQEIDEEVDVSQPGNYYYNNQEIGDKLKVKIIIAQAIPDFQLGSSLASVTCNVGQTVTTTITVTPLNGFTGTTKLSALVLPSGISVSISPQNVKGSGTAILTINCSTPGSFTVEVRGVTSYETHSITIPVTVNGTTLPSFIVTGELSTLQCTQGGTATDDITVTAKNGFTGPVTLSTEITPSGTTATISPTSLSGHGSASLTVHCTTTGIYTVKVKGASGDLSSTFTVTTTVTSSSTGDFTITADPTSLSKEADETGTSTVKVTGADSFAGPVALILSAPTGLTCQAIPSTLTISTAGGDASTPLKCSSHTPGTYTATITGSAAGKTHKVDVTFTVTGTSQAANSPTMFGVDPMMFYGIIGVVAIAAVGSGLFLLRRGR